MTPKKYKDKMDDIVYLDKYWRQLNYWTKLKKLE